MKNILNLLFIILITYSVTSCGKSSEHPTPYPQAPIVDTTVEPAPEVDIPVAEDEADTYGGRFGIYIEQGSTLETQIDIGCANGESQRRGRLTFRIITGSNGVGLHVYRKVNNVIDSEEAVELLPNSVYYLNTEFTSTETLGINSDTEGDLATCNL